MEDSAAALSLSYVRNELAKLDTRITKLLHRRFGRPGAQEAAVLALLAETKSAELDVETLADLALKVSEVRTLRSEVYDAVSLIFAFHQAAAPLPPARVEPVLDLLLQPLAVTDPADLLTSYLRCLITLFTMIRSDESANEPFARWHAKNEQLLYHSLTLLFDHEQVAPLSYQCLKYSCLTLQSSVPVWLSRLARFLGELEAAVLAKVPEERREDLKFSPPSQPAKLASAHEDEHPPEARTEADNAEDSVAEIENSPELCSNDGLDSVRDGASPNCPFVEASPGLPTPQPAPPRVLQTDPPPHVPAPPTVTSGQRVIFVLDCFYENVAALHDNPLAAEWLTQRVFPAMVEALKIVEQIKVPLPLFVRVVSISCLMWTLVDETEPAWSDCYLQIFELLKAPALRRKIATLQTLLHHMVLQPVPGTPAITQRPDYFLTGLVKFVQTACRELIEGSGSGKPCVRPELLQTQSFLSGEQLGDYVTVEVNPQSPIYSLTKSSYRKRLSAFCTKQPAAVTETVLSVFFLLPSQHEFEDDDWLQLLLLDQKLDLFYAVARLLTHSDAEPPSPLPELFFDLGTQLLTLFPCNKALQEQLVCTLVSLARLVPDVSPWIDRWIEADAKEMFAVAARLVVVKQLTLTPLARKMASWLLEDIPLSSVMQVAGAQDRDSVFTTLMLTTFEPPPCESASPYPPLLSKERALLLASYFIANVPPEGAGSGHTIVRSVQAIIHWQREQTSAAFLDLLRSLAVTFSTPGDAEGRSEEDQSRLTEIVAASLATKSMNPRFLDQVVALIQVCSLMCCNKCAPLTSLIHSAVNSLALRLDYPEVLADAISIMLLSARVTGVYSTAPIDLMETYCRYQTTCPTMSVAHAVLYLLQWVCERRQDSSLRVLKAINVAWQIAESIKEHHSSPTLPAADDGATPGETEAGVYAFAQILDSAGVDLPKFSFVDECPIRNWRADCRLTGSAQCKDIFGVVIDGLVLICMRDADLAVRLSGLKTFVSLLRQGPAQPHSYKAAYEQLLRSYQTDLLDNLLTPPTGETSHWELYKYAIDNCPASNLALLSCSEVLTALCKMLYSTELAAKQFVSVEHVLSTLSTLSQLTSNCLIWMAYLTEEADGVEMIGRVCFHICNLSTSRKALLSSESDPVEVSRLVDTCRQFDRCVRNALCDTLVHLISPQQNDQMTPKVELFFLYIISLVLFNIDASESLFEEYHLPLDQLNTRFERCLEYAMRIVEDVTDAAETEVGGMTEDIAVRQASAPYYEQLYTDAPVKEPFAGLYILNPPRLAAGGTNSGSVGTLLSFLGTARWHATHEHLWTVMRNIFENWLKEQDWEQPTKLGWRTLILQTLVGAASRQNLVLCRAGLESADDFSEQRLLDSYQPLVEFTTVLKAQRREFTGPQQLALNMVGPAHAVALLNMTQVARSRKSETLFKAITDGIVRNLTGKYSQPFHRLIQLWLVPAAYDANLSIVIEYIVLAVAGEDRKWAALANERGECYNTMATLFHVCCFCNSAKPEWLNLTCPGFVNAALYLNEEIHRRLSQENDNNHAIQPSFFDWTPIPDHPSMTEAEKKVTQCFLEILGKVPSWYWLSRENKRAIAKMLVEVATTLNFCRDAVRVHEVLVILDHLL